MDLGIEVINEIFSKKTFGEIFEIADENTLLSIENKNPKQKYRAFIAVFADKIRLIDNISL